MKKILLSLLLLSTLVINSQNLILTKAANEAVIGDTSRVYIIDTTAYTGGLNAALTGTNMVWTYTNLVATSNKLTSAYINPTSVPSATGYAGCTVVQNQGTTNSFYKSSTTPSTQTEFMGVNSTSLTLKFTNTAVSARYPFTIGDSFSDSYSGSFTFSLSGTATGNATVTADGAGTLNLPYGITLTNVLRVKSVQTTSLNAIIINGTINQTVYYFYHSSQKFPILTINYQSIAIAGSPTISASVSGNINNFTVGLKENNFNVVNSNLYPNPARDIFNVKFNNSLNELASIEIYNLTGQLAKTVVLGNSSSIDQNVSLQGLKSGIYMVKTILGNRNSIKKLIVE